MKHVDVRLLLLSPILLFIVPFATSQTMRYEYAAKFICGVSDGKIIAPGSYSTSINVHYPDTMTGKVVSFKKRFVVALPHEKPGVVSKFVIAQLSSDQAFEVDCADIREHLNAGPAFVDGFVVIESPVELDVVALYTATGASKQVDAIHLDRVPARELFK